jgi:hypothetical protein
MSKLSNRQPVLELQDLYLLLVLASCRDLSGSRGVLWIVDVQLFLWIGGVFDPKGFDLNRINRDWKAARARRSKA